MTEHEQDFLRYLEEIEHACDMLDRYTALLDNHIDQYSFNWVCQKRNLNTMMKHADEDLQQRVYRSSSYLTIRRDLMEDIAFFWGGVENMNRIHRYKLW